jgi:hypothetical protein
MSAFGYFADVSKRLRNGSSSPMLWENDLVGFRVA